MNDVLTDVEKKSAVWLKLQAHLEARLLAARARNDAPLTPEQTQKLRGEIAALKEFLRLGETHQPVAEHETLDN